MGQYLLALAAALVVGAVIFGITVLVTGSDPGLGEVEPDGRATPLPGTRPLLEGDVNDVRFDTGWRGYRMAQVDAALRRAAYDIGYKDELIGVLEAEVAALREGRMSDAEVLRRAREAALVPVVAGAAGNGAAGNGAGGPPDSDRADLDGPPDADPDGPAGPPDPDPDGLYGPASPADADPDGPAGPANADPDGPYGPAGPADADPDGPYGPAGPADADPDDVDGPAGDAGDDDPNPATGVRTADTDDEEPGTARPQAWSGDEPRDASAPVDAANRPERA
jgi:DivIVA domain-containing protein